MGNRGHIMAVRIGSEGVVQQPRSRLTHCGDHGWQHRDLSAPGASSAPGATPHLISQGNSGRRKITRSLRLDFAMSCAIGI